MAAQELYPDGVPKPAGGEAEGSLDAVEVMAATLAAATLDGGYDGSVDVDAIATAVLAADAAAAPCAALAALGADLTAAAAFAIDRRCAALREGRGNRRVGYAVTAAAAGDAISTLFQDSQNPCGVGVGVQDYAGGAVVVEARLCVEIFAVDGDVRDWLCVYAPAIELRRGAYACGEAYRGVEAAARNGMHAGVVCGVGWSEVCSLGAIPDSPVSLKIGGVGASAARVDVVATVARLKAALDAGGAPLQGGVRVLLSAGSGARDVSAADGGAEAHFERLRVECSVLEKADVRGARCRSLSTEAY